MTATSAPAFSKNARIILEKRYLRHGPEYPVCEECLGGDIANHECDGRHESIDQFLDRIASFGNCQNPDHGHTEAQFRAYREMFERLDFLPNTPALINMGFGNSLSACFTFVPSDNLVDLDDPGIMAVGLKAAGVMKYGGGVGYGVSSLRAKGAPIQSTHKQACGPVAVLRYYDQIARLVTQGGVREGAQIGILRVDHPDIYEFVHMKDGTYNLPPSDPRSMSTFNISVGMTDEFMQAAERGRGMLGGAEDTAAFALLQDIALSAWRSGDPGMFFLDAVNRHHYAPHLGPIEACNPCGEVPQMDNEACTLGSINLGNFAGDMALVDWERLRSTVHLATNYLDEVLDHDSYPDPAIHEAVAKTRKIGLGVCGWADLLAKHRIKYASHDAVTLGGRVMQFIDEAAASESVMLGKRKGKFPEWREGAPYRNATRTCIAPTGTISQLMGASSGIEPYFALSNSRRMGDGTMLEESAGEFGDFIPDTAMEIDWKWHVRHQAAFQEHTNLAVSKTINMPESATPDDILDAYFMMWSSGCKGGTVYRNNSRTLQTLTVDEPTLEQALMRGLAEGLSDWRDAALLDDGEKDQPRRRKPPRQRRGYTVKLDLGETEGYMTTGEFPDGTLAELFLNISRQGSTLDGFADAFAIAVSLGLQHGVPLETFRSKFEGTRFEPSGMTRDMDVPNATSFPDFIFRKLAAMYPSGGRAAVPETDLRVAAAPALSGMLCPDCGHQVVAEEGCLKCVAEGCGWNRCG